MNAKELYAIKPDEYGRRRLVDVKFVNLGNGVRLGAGITLGEGVTIGRGVTIGKLVTIGNWVTIGEGVRLGDGVTLGDGVNLSNGVRLGEGVILGNCAALGEGVRLGRRVTLGKGVRIGKGVKYETTPLQIQCHPYMVYPHSKGHIGVGCIVHPIEDWLGEEEPKELSYHPECLPWSNYRKAIEMLAEWMEKNP